MVAVTTEGDAELTGKCHDHVMRDVRVMLVDLHGEDGLSIFASSYTNEQNKALSSALKLRTNPELTLLAVRAPRRSIVPLK